MVRKMSSCFMQTVLRFALVSLLCTYISVASGGTIACGNTHTCVILQSGALKCFGLNVHGELGLGDTLPRGDSGGPSAMVSLQNVDLDGNRAVNVVATHSGGTTCVLRGDQQVTCFGLNDGGELAQEDRVDRGDDPHEVGNNITTIDFGLAPAEFIVQLDGGHRSFCALSNLHRVRCWGHRNFGSMGLGTLGGSNYGSEANQTGEFFHVLDFGVTDKKQVVAGRYHQCVRTFEGRVRCMGDNGIGQLGWTQGSNNISTNPGNGNFWIGDNPNETGEFLQDADLGVPPSDEAVHLCAGQDHTCAAFESGGVKCWGRNELGQLGIGDTVNPNNRIGNDPDEMGANLDFIDLGLLAGEKVTQLSCGLVHVCALVSNGGVKCWGDGRFNVDVASIIGTTSGQMGSDLDYLDFGTSELVVFIASSNDHNCALFANAEMKCWGSNSGRLGQGDTTVRGNTVQTLGANIPFLTLGELVSLNFNAPLLTPSPTSPPTPHPTRDPTLQPTSTSVERRGCSQFAASIATIVALFFTRM